MAEKAIVASRRLALERELARVAAEIRSYPAPIPACDAQYNHLLEERARISRELTGLGDDSGGSAEPQPDR
jgi:hypothetical protein